MIGTERSTASQRTARPSKAAAWKYPPVAEVVRLQMSEVSRLRLRLIGRFSRAAALEAITKPGQAHCDCTYFLCFPSWPGASPGFVLRIVVSAGNGTNWAQPIFTCRAVHTTRGMGGPEFSSRSHRLAPRRTTKSIRLELHSCKIACYTTKSRLARAHGTDCKWNSQASTGSLLPPTLRW
jgi:hypothetical protein